MVGTFNQSLQCTQDVFVGSQAPSPPVSSDALVSWMITHNFTLQNRQGEITFFRKRDERIQTSILDLTWMNTAATNLTDNFSIR